MEIKLNTLFIDLLPEPVVLIDDQGMILETNKAAEILDQGHELTGNNLKDYLFPHPSDFIHLMTTDEIKKISITLNNTDYYVRIIPVPETGFMILFLKYIDEQDRQKIGPITSHEPIRDLYAHMLDLIEAERKRISGKLHDTVSQNLLFINMLLRNSSNEQEYQDILAKVIPAIDSVLEEIKAISKRLKPIISKDVDLITAIITLVTKLNGENGIKGEVNYSGHSERLDIKTETLLYGIVNEAVTNILKHSKAENYTVQIINKTSSIILIISDDGIGFYLFPSQNVRLGITRMKTITEIINGTFNIESSPGNGTVINISIPRNN